MANKKEKETTIKLKDIHLFSWTMTAIAKKTKLNEK